MEEFFNEKVLGGLVAGALAIGASFLPIVKFFYRRHKSSQEEATNANSNVITIGGGTDPSQIQYRIERLEDRVDKIRDELTELRIKG